MKDSYCLRIEVTNINHIQLLDLLLDQEHNTDSPDWEFEMEEEEFYGDCPMIYISLLLDLIRNKFDDLEKIGIKRDMISIWRVVNYEREWYMEYQPSDLKELVEYDISFRISCYPTDDTMPAEIPTEENRILN
ncbi:MAG: hypothetical protein RR397_06150 [Odoribacter sp.]